jgi:hypothetical protein
MKYLLTPALVAAAFALPLAAAAQERYPALNPDQLSPEQKAYVENLQKPPRNAPPFEEPALQGLPCSPELANKLRRCRTTCAGAPGLLRGSPNLRS